MDIKLSNIKNLKKLEKGIGELLKKHIFLTWLFLGFALLLFASYIFYFTIYFAITTEPQPSAFSLLIQKSQFNQILNDLNEREQKKAEFKTQAHINLFEFQP